MNNTHELTNYLACYGLRFSTGNIIRQRNGEWYSERKAQEVIDQHLDKHFVVNGRKSNYYIMARFSNWSCCNVIDCTDTFNIDYSINGYNYTIKIINDGSIAFENLQFELSFFKKGWSLKKIVDKSSDNIYVVFADYEDYFDFLNTQKVIENESEF